MNDAQVKGWEEYGKRLQTMIRNGNSESTFVFIRCDTQPDGSMLTEASHYQMEPLTRMAVVNHQMQALKEDIDAGPDPDLKYKIKRVLDLYNKFFSYNGEKPNMRNFN